MYKGCRYFLLLAALIMGLGVLGGANDAEAAQVTSVSIVTPDSGVVRGIDSLIVATVNVFDVGPSTEDLSVVIWLTAAGADANADSVVGELNDIAHDYEGEDGAKRKISGIDLSTSSTTGHQTLGEDIDEALAGTLVRLIPGDDREGNSRTAGGIVAVLKTKSTDSKDKFKSKDFVGNADSVVTKNTSSGHSFTWYLRVPAEAAALKKIRVAAVVVDTKETSSAARLGESPVVKVSPASQQFNVDGDRPINPSAEDAFVNAGTQGRGFWNEEEEDVDGTQTDISDLVFGRLMDDAITSPGRRKGREASGFDRGKSQILGIGDSLRVSLKLGPDAGTILLGDDNVGAIIFGTHFAMDKNSHDDGEVQLGLRIAEGMFGCRRRRSV